MKMKTKTPQKKFNNLANAGAIQKGKKTPLNKKNISTVVASKPQLLKNTGTPKKIQNAVKNGTPKVTPAGNGVKKAQVAKGKKQAVIAKKVVPKEESSEEEEDEDEEDDDDEEEDEDEKESHFVSQEAVEDDDDEDDEGEDDGEDEEEDDDEEDEDEKEKTLVTVTDNLGEDEDDDDDDDDDDDEDEEDVDETAEVANKMEVEENDDDDDDDDDEEEEDDDDDEDDDEDENEVDNDKKVIAPKKSQAGEVLDDEAPVAAPIVKKKNETADDTGERGKFTNESPDKFPQENVVYIKTGPAKLKVMRLFNVFKSFGNITNLHISEETASVAFATKDSAVLALLLYPVLPLKHDEPMTTSSNVFTAEQLQKLESKTVIIKSFMKVADAKNVFDACGKILYLSVVPQKNLPNAKNVALVFDTVAAAKKALQMHNSIVGERNILLMSLKQEHKNDADRTIRILNTANHTNFNVDTLLKIFKDCGEIEHIDVLCNKKLLAVIIFKDEEGFKKAYELQGQTLEDLYILLESDSKDAKEMVMAPKKTQIFVSNIKPGTAEEELRALFEGTIGAGSIKSFRLNNGSGFIDFETVDQYCKSFTLDESMVNGQRIYIQPFALHKRKRGPNDDDNGPAKRRFNGPPNARGGGNFKPNFNRGNQQNDFKPRFFNDNQNGGGGGGGNPRFNRNDDKRPYFYKNTSQQNDFKPRFNNNGQSGQGPPRKFNNKPGGHPFAKRMYNAE